MQELKLTVQDVLRRKSFRNAEVIAGSNGLNRPVKWSHILETQDFESLVNGGELILTTGLGFQLNLAAQLQYVERLIEKNVSAICIEVGPDGHKMPPEIIDLANRHGFPVIVFKEIVRFVDITQDLHTHIINQHHEMLSQLDRLSRKFISLSMTQNGILRILQEIHRLFQQNTFFIDKHLKPFYYPAEGKSSIEIIQEYIETEIQSTDVQKVVFINEHAYAFMPVRGLGQTWGFLCMKLSESYSEDFLFLLLDRAALAVAQILLRNKTIEERKQNMEDDLVRNLLNGRSYEEDELQTYLPSSNQNTYFRVFVIKLEVGDINTNEIDWEEIKLRRAILIRSLFKRNGFFPAVSIRKNEIAVIASFIANDPLKITIDPFVHIMKQVSKIDEQPFSDKKSYRIGISHVYKNFADTQIGYEETKKVLVLNASKIVQTHFYEELGIYRLLLRSESPQYLESFALEYLTPLLNYDAETESNLLETLKVYLECQGSKKETSERLYIVRQTLYHRLGRIEQLLGHDFMQPSNRLALEVAIRAYELVKSN